MELSNRIMYKLTRDSQPGAWLVDLIPMSEETVHYLDLRLLNLLIKCAIYLSGFQAPPSNAMPNKFVVSWTTGSRSHGN